MQGHDFAAAPDPKEDAKRPSHPPAQAAGSLPSRSVGSTPGDPLLLAILPVSLDFLLLHSRLPRGVRPRLEGKPTAPLSPSLWT